MKAVALISGGIDSPVAVDMMLKRGYDVVLIHFDNSPLAPKIVLSKVKELAKKLAKENKTKLKLYIVPHGENLKECVKVTKKFNCILCRRMMYKIANGIAKKEKAQGIITGENLAQVASQTLSNLITETSASKLPVLRPLIGFDKEEIIKKAKKIGTYEISIQKEKACKSEKRRYLCCYATPIVAATRSRIELIKRFERKLKPSVLVKNSIKNSKILEF